ncbi:MAG: 3-oxoacyl-ACP reductase [Gammaproteobacteria bacterium RIFCSPLOWO2_02_FULL_61_13]|nr:MAG: 3-oxoacyl-ACP reductase [Gammaproteobacteria bacterium RIFCSPLOWO2_02_FULL_61_13]
MLLKNKVVFVTGGGTGIGAAVAETAVRDGANVVVMGRRADTVQAVASRIGPATLSHAGDAASTADVRAAIQQAHAAFGGLDAVVACAGTVEVGAVADTDDDSWRRMMYSNLDTAFVTAREALPSLIERRGAIVIVSSIAGLEAMPSSCGYITAKHAVIGLGRSLAFDYGAHGVRTNVVCPGWIRTPMADAEMAAIMARDSISLDDAYALVTSETPLKRPGTAAEVAELCCYLISERASLITGAVITVDAGSTVVSVPTLKM